MSMMEHEELLVICDTYEIEANGRYPEKLAVRDYFPFSESTAKRRRRDGKSEYQRIGGRVYYTGLQIAKILRGTPGTPPTVPAWTPPPISPPAGAGGTHPKKPEDGVALNVLIKKLKRETEDA